jgi:Zn finger protein HypA/HybF involved in hydrogenase expression
MRQQIKETGGYYNGQLKTVEWYCSDCSQENATIVKFGYGTHLLICPTCKTKRNVIVRESREE